MCVACGVFVLCCVLCFGLLLFWCVFVCLCVWFVFVSAIVLCLCLIVLIVSDRLLFVFVCVVVFRCVCSDCDGLMCVVGLCDVIVFVDCCYVCFMCAVCFAMVNVCWCILYCVYSDLFGFGYCLRT